MKKNYLSILLFAFMYTMIYPQVCFAYASSLACYYYNPHFPVLGNYKNMPYVWALDEEGEYFKFEGENEDFFFHPKDEGMSFEKLKSLCENSIPEGMEFYSAEAANHFFDFSPKIIVTKNESEKQNSIKKFILFGDSISDTGGMHKWVKTVPAGVYWNAHFTNGWTWMEYLSKFMKDFPVLNWSYAGMKTSHLNVTDANTMKDKIFDYLYSNLTGNFETELKKYLSGLNKKDDHLSNMYFIWLGANNYFNLMRSKTLMNQIEDEKLKAGISQVALSYADKSTDDIIGGIESLRKVKAKNFLVIDLPDLGKLPILDSYAAFMKNLTHLTELHNGLLKEKISLYQKNHPEIKIIFISAYDFMNKIRENPEDFAIKNVTEACFKKSSFSGTKEDVCSNQNDYLFYDLAHPTSRIHCFVGHRIHEILFNEGLTSLIPLSQKSAYDYCVKESERILIKF